MSDDAHPEQGGDTPHLVIQMVSGGGIKPSDQVQFTAADGYSNDDWNAMDDELDGWWLNDIYPYEEYPSDQYDDETVLGTITFDSPSDDDPEFDWWVESRGAKA